MPCGVLSKVICILRTTCLSQRSLISVVVHGTMGETHCTIIIIVDEPSHCFCIGTYLQRVHTDDRWTSRGLGRLGLHDKERSKFKARLHRYLLGCGVSSLSASRKCDVRCETRNAMCTKSQRYIPDPRSSTPDPNLVCNDGPPSRPHLCNR